MQCRLSTDFCSCRLLSKRAHLAEGVLDFVKVGSLVEAGGHQLGQQRFEQVGERSDGAARQELDAEPPGVSGIVRARLVGEGDQEADSQQQRSQEPGSRVLPAARFKPELLGNAQRGPPLLQQALAGQWEAAVGCRQHG